MHNYKWGKILKNFVKSDRAIIRLTDPINVESLSHCIKYNEKAYGNTIGHVKRGDSVYIFKKDIPITDMEDAINGIYEKTN